MPYKGFIVANPLGQAINGQVLLLDFQISNFIQKDWKENSTPQLTILHIAIIKAFLLLT